MKSAVFMNLHNFERSKSDPWGTPHFLSELAFNSRFQWTCQGNILQSSTKKTWKILSPMWQLSTEGEIRQNMHAGSRSIPDVAFTEAGTMGPQSSVLWGKQQKKKKRATLSNQPLSHPYKTHTQLPQLLTMAHCNELNHPAHCTCCSLRTGTCMQVHVCMPTHQPISVPKSKYNTVNV